MKIVEIIKTRIVAGTAVLQYFAQPTGYPALPATEVPTTFALAPIGVALPPMSVPIESDQVITVSGRPVLAARDWITGIMVAAKGMLSIKADAIADIHIIIAILHLVV